MGHPACIFALEIAEAGCYALAVQLTVLQTINFRVMEIKLRANIVMSKELTIEANDWTEALEKAQAMMAEPIPYKELTPTRVFYDEISPMNWMSDEKWMELSRRCSRSSTCWSSLRGISLLPACRCGITRCFR